MTTMWGDCPRADIVDAWGEALGAVPVDHIRMALGGVMQAYPEWPPTLGQFLALCKPPPIPAAQLQYRPAPRQTMPPEIAAKLADFGKPKADPKRWAREILAGAEAGTYRLPIGIWNARLALGLEQDEAVDIESARGPADVRISTFLEIDGNNQKVELR